MKLLTATRAYLAARFPCAFEEPVLLDAVNRSGVVDAPAHAEALSSALSTLPVSRYFDGLTASDLFSLLLQ